MRLLNLAGRVVYNEDVYQSLGDVKEANDKTNKKLNDLHDLLREQMHSMEEGFSKISGVGKTLDDFLVEFADKQSEFTESVKVLYRSLDPKTISDQLKKGLEEAGEILTSGLEKSLTSMNDSLARMSKLQEDREQLLTLSHKELESWKTKVSEAQKEFIAAHTQLVRKLEETDLKGEVSKGIRESAEQVGTSFKTATDGLVRDISIIAVEVDHIQKKRARRNSRRGPWGIFGHRKIGTEKPEI